MGARSGLVSSPKLATKKARDPAAPCNGVSRVSPAKCLLEVVELLGGVFEVLVDLSRNKLIFNQLKL